MSNRLYYTSLAVAFTAAAFSIGPVIDIVLTEPRQKRVAEDLQRRQELCLARWANSGLTSRYSPETGCQVQVEPGRWFPEDNVGWGRGGPTFKPSKRLT